MGHESTARLLLAVGADFYPPSGLFRNIWDPDELIKLVQTSKKSINTLRRIRGRPLSLLYTQAAAQFDNMGHSSSAEEMNRRAMKENWQLLTVKHSYTILPTTRTR